MGANALRHFAIVGKKRPEFRHRIDYAFPRWAFRSGTEICPNPLATSKASMLFQIDITDEFDAAASTETARDNANVILHGFRIDLLIVRCHSVKD